MLENVKLEINMPKYLYDALLATMRRAGHKMSIPEFMVYMLELDEEISDHIDWWEVHCAENHR